MSKSAPSLPIEPGFSATLYAILIAIHATALVAASISPWFLWAKLVCMAAIVASAYLNISPASRHGEINSLHMMTDGSWRLLLRDKRECRCELAAESLVTPGFALLVFSCPDGRRRMLIFRDSLDGESYRKLRVVLRVHGGKPAAGNPGNTEG